MKILEKMKRWDGSDWFIITCGTAISLILFSVAILVASLVVKSVVGLSMP